jgi:hypothetical protein
MGGVAVRRVVGSWRLKWEWGCGWTRGGEGEGGRGEGRGERGEKGEVVISGSGGRPLLGRRTTCARYQERERESGGREREIRSRGESLFKPQMEQQVKIGIQTYARQSGRGRGRGRKRRCVDEKARTRERERGVRRVNFGTQEWFIGGRSLAVAVGRCWQRSFIAGSGRLLAMVAAAV